MEFVKTIFRLRPQTGLTNLNSDGDNIFHLLSKHRLDSLPIIQLLSDMNFINNTNKLGFTPLQTAVRSGNFDTAEVLVKYGALVIDNPLSYPLIHLAAANGATSFLQLLLSKGVDPNTIDCFGNTPLHLAASKGNEYLMFNIELPALYTHEALAALDICRRSVTGQPSTLTRQDADHAGLVETLLQHDADQTVLNNSHRTPIDSAQFFQSNDLVQILKQLL